MWSFNKNAILAIVLTHCGLKWLALCMRITIRYHHTGLILDLHFSQWEISLQNNAVSHWLGTNLESALIICITRVKKEPIHSPTIPRTGPTNGIVIRYQIWLKYINDFSLISLIITKSCTYHYGASVLGCTKFCCDQINLFQTNTLVIWSKYHWLKMCLLIWKKYQ